MTMTETGNQAVVPESEEEKVYFWRFEQFAAIVSQRKDEAEKLGFEPDTLGAILANSEIDLTEFRTLIDADCSLRLAIKILW